MIKKTQRENAIAIVVFIILAFIANWSILIGENLMKWDIWDAEYPFQVIMSDAIRQGHLMLWLPLMHFGSPYYAMVGTPVWYPITILIDILGYGPFSPALEYSIHMIIGALGMFLLSRYLLREDIDDDKSSLEFILALSMGVLYEFNGVFLSNAEHIMIIISAAWIPFSLYYAKRYVDSENVLEAMKCGITSGMIMLGGYPELFADLFIALVPCIFVWVYMRNVNINSILKMLLVSAYRFIIIVILTLAFSAITVIPFINVMGEITRGNGMTPFTLPFSTLVSILLPLAINTSHDWSMSIFYVGFVTCISIVLVPFVKRANALVYMIFAFVSLFMCFGSDSFLQSLFYRFVPMYSTFRFPQLWRTFFAVFALLSVAQVWKELFSGNEWIESSLLAVFKVFAIAAGVVGALLVIIFYISTANTDLDRIQLIADGCLLLMIICFLYWAIIRLNTFKKYSVKTRLLLFLAIVIFEVLSVAYKVFPVTVASYEAIAYTASHDRNSNPNKAKYIIENEKSLYDNRIYDCSFIKSKRSRNGLNSKNIAFNKTFDEEGYLSVKLANTETYKASYNRSIIQQNPEAYFTNDIVNSDSISLEEWRMRPDVSEYQIYTDDVDLEIQENQLVSVNTNIIDKTELEICDEDGMYYVEGDFRSESQVVCKLRFGFPEAAFDHDVSMKLYFIDENDNSYNYVGSYKVKNMNGMYGFDISLPSVSINYVRVGFSASEEPIKICKLDVERNVTDTYAEITGFTFNAININVYAPTDGIVAVLQAKYPGWNAYVDGQKVDIAEIDGCFMGVPVDVGEHTVQLRFRPMDFYLGLFITMIYIIVFIGVMIYKQNKLRIN